MTRLAARDVHLTDWRWQLGTLRADFATRSLAQATAFLTDVSPLLDGEATVPVVQVNRDRVLITLKDPSEGVTRREAELADRLDVSRQAVNAIETGKYDPSLPLAFRIADLFGLPIEQIFLKD